MYTCFWATIDEKGSDKFLRSLNPAKVELIPITYREYMVPILYRKSLSPISLSEVLSTGSLPWIFKWDPRFMILIFNTAYLSFWSHLTWLLELFSTTCQLTSLLEVSEPPVSEVLIEDQGSHWGLIAATGSLQPQDTSPIACFHLSSSSDQTKIIQFSLMIINRVVS